VKKREIKRQVDELRGDVRLFIDRLDGLVREEVHVRRIKKRLDEIMARPDVARLDDLLKKVDWMHERIDLLANRVDKMRAAERKPKAGSRKAARR
jgi:hypothetical protein